MPQSRPRAFIIAASDELSLDGLTQQFPAAPFHPSSLVRAADTVNDPDWIWWSLTLPDRRSRSFGDLCERDAPCDPPAKDKGALRYALHRE